MERIRNGYYIYYIAKNYPHLFRDTVYEYHTEVLRIPVNRLRKILRIFTIQN